MVRVEQTAKGVFECSRVMATKDVLERGLIRHRKVLEAEPAFECLHRTSTMVVYSRVYIVKLLSTM